MIFERSTVVDEHVAFFSAQVTSITESENTSDNYGSKLHTSNIDHATAVTTKPDWATQARARDKRHDT